jgi:putative CocE/NonD family hydrolase
MTLDAGLAGAHAGATDPPSMLTWNSEPLNRDFDMTGDIELRLDATGTASDTAWIVTLQDVDASGAAVDVTAGYLRASLREVDEASSRHGAPVLTCRNPEAVPIGDVVSYRVPLVPNARRFRAGHRIRLVISSDDHRALRGLRIKVRQLHP